MEVGMNKKKYWTAEKTLLQCCCVGYFVNLIYTSIIWEERTWIEKPSINKSMGAFCRILFMWDTHHLYVVPPLGIWFLTMKEIRLNKPWIARQQRTFLHSLCFNSYLQVFFFPESLSWLPFMRNYKLQA